MKLMSWNVNGVRSITKKDFFAQVEQMDPDVLCLQETKATEQITLDVLDPLEGYHVFALGSNARQGYSGTAILTKVEPHRVLYGIDSEHHDQEGRVIIAEYSKFQLLNVYAPNSGEGLRRLEYRQDWDVAFRSRARELDQDKPLIICGDLNVAHTEMDIARPKANYNKSSGYTQVEIDGFSELLKAGFVDSFRDQHPQQVKYSWWNYRFRARERNVGWRIDYFLVSSRLASGVGEASIENEMFGSDHCPVGLVLDP